jgi:CubicO group peptidase (beta-lactamase class C family)
MDIDRVRLLVLVAGLWPTIAARVKAEDPPARMSWDWTAASPESQGMSSTRLESARADLSERRTTAFLVVRHDRIVFERYASGHGRTKPHYTASMAKALVGGLGLMVAMSDGRIGPDDPASRYVPAWREDPRRRAITVKHLATHTSGIEDAEADGLPHDRLTGWKGDFWKRLPPPQDPFTIARDRAPVVDVPGTRERYSNPGMAMLGYCVTSSLRGSDDADLRSLLRRRIMRPLGLPDAEWSVGYGSMTTVDGLPLVATWGGGSYSPNAVARVGRLLLHRGRWEGRDRLVPAVVDAALRPSGLPGHSGLGWWVNSGPEETRPWKSGPEDAFGGAGAGQQFLLVVPSLDLIVVRNGDRLDPTLSFDEGLDRYVVAPVVRAISTRREAPYPPSPVIRGVRWAPQNTIVRKARGSDTWPMTWADDDALYTAYGDGRGFEPFVPAKLSLGYAKVVGPPEEFIGINIRSASGERTGEGASGQKASGMLMVGGILYLWVRNAGNSELAWSSDRAKTWTWSGWRFETSFGCPTFLNFGKDYAGARDDFVYVYSPDGDSAYRAADRMVLARVAKAKIAERGAYEFFRGLGPAGMPLWTKDMADRRAVFSHPGGCYRSGISYDAGLRRYLWCQTLPGGDARFRGGFGIYDAPEPWGPWTTVSFIEEWDVGPGETCSFPTKWMSADGKTVDLVFSGDDAFSIRRATLVVADPSGKRE